MMTHPSAVLCLAFAAASCAGSEPRDPEAGGPGDAAAPRSIPLDDERLAALRGADRFVLGRIVEVGPSPGVWSGVVATFQPVVFHVEERLDVGGSGWPQPGDRLPVFFGIVGPPDCDPSSPRLDPRVHRVGARGVVAFSIGGPAFGDEPLRHPLAAYAESSFHEVRSDAELARGRFRGAADPRGK